MPRTKNTASAKNKKPANKKTTRASGASRTDGKGARKSSVSKEEKKRYDKSSFSAQLAPYVMAVLALFVGVCMFAGDNAGVIGGALRSFLLGMNGAVAYVIPLFVLIQLFMWNSDMESGAFHWKFVCEVFTYTFVSALLHIFFEGDSSFSVVSHYKNGVEMKGGGVVGGFLGEAMLTGFGKAGSLVLIFALLFVCVLYVFGITPRGLWILIAYKIKTHRDDRAKRSSNAVFEKNNRREDEYKRYLSDRKRERSDKRVSVAETEAVGEATPSADVPIRFKYKKKRSFSPDIPIDEEPSNETSLDEANAEASEDEINEKIFEEVMKRTKERMDSEHKTEKEEQNDLDEEKSALESQVADEEVEALEPILEIKAEDLDMDSEKNDLKDIFVNPEDAELLDKLAAAYLTDDEKSKDGSSFEIKRAGLGSASATDLSAESEEIQEKVQEKIYAFPPMDLLHEDRERRDVNIKEELHENAVKLVDTLKSFNVKTKIENVSRGPTITRYELLPEPGTRVRSIVNLVDDISLNLATTGVRIEAPVPGKSVVGIEVPNKKQATVHLRTLLEDKRFVNSESKLTCALGEDVAGEAIYLNIAKMPHLLIAGATGMGKSVCINSLIVSLLYKATPEEVKLILIDPKKVELNIYNGIPHLLVPVVSDPKKAAGSLSWAVSEMERRFGLIESVGVRNVTAFNEITKNDPEYEFLPYIVIIIDELADLMMTAPDDVEESICRLMQKARAAGMHVIIGTQRPSVDVITGLIKANIPSRIAFTVASQVDSRTIIDRTGAENLIGRGDMLYIPVGASKPMRVQGSFVSEGDVEKVVTYIKDMNDGKESTYSEEVIEQIEQEAAKCGTGKKGSGAKGGGGDIEGSDDPMLKDALELAVNSGKISTSLIQRRLSLGYGRAARIIDRMEQLGYVSSPEGQKPREVLITKEQFMEMVLKNDENITPQDDI